MLKAIIFDIDGVLLDSFESNLAFFQELMKAAGYRPPTAGEYAPLFHRTLRDVVQVLTGLTDEAEVQKIWDLAHVVDLKVRPPILYKGVAKTVRLLSKAYPLAIATSRIQPYAYEPPLDALKHYFTVTVTYEDTKNHKPHPEPLLLAAERLDVLPEECVYVGDVENDMKAARAAGIKFLLYSGEKLQGADQSTADFASIPELVKRL